MAEKAFTFVATTARPFLPCGARYWRSHDHSGNARRLSKISRRWWWATSAWIAGALTIPPRPSHPVKPASPAWASSRAKVTPGGGGTVANNLAALGAGRVSVLGIRGDDGFGFELVRALNQRGISADLMVEIPRWQTFTYTKLLNCETGIEDQPRVDFISTRPVPAEAEKRVIENLISAVEGFDVVLVADQAETACGRSGYPGGSLRDRRACRQVLEQGISSRLSKARPPFPASDGQAESCRGGGGLPGIVRAGRFPAPA